MPSQKNINLAIKILEQYAYEEEDIVEQNFDFNNAERWLNNTHFWDNRLCIMLLEGKPITKSGYKKYLLTR